MYTINILSNDVFDNLPSNVTRGSDISRSLGFADPKTGQAYVRYTAHNDLTKYLIDHEFEELVMNESAHEDENGIRHKDSGGFLGGLQSVGRVALPIIGTALGGPVGGMIGGAAAGGLGSIGQKGGFGNVLQNSLMGGLSGGVGSMFGGGGGSAASTFGQQALAPSRAGMMAGMSGAGGQGMFSSLSKLIPQGANPLGFLQGQAPQLSGTSTGAINQGGGGLLKKLFGGLFGGGSQTPTQPAQPASQGGGFLNQLFSNTKDIFTKPQTYMGLASMLGGSRVQNPQVPKLPPSIDELREQIQGGGSAIGQLGQKQLRGLLKEPMQAVTQQEQDAALRQLETEHQASIDQVRDLYRNIRPGTSPEDDSSYRRDIQEVNDRFARAKTDTVAQLSRQTYNDFQSNRLRQVIAAGGMDQNQTQQLMQLAQMDVGQIMAQLQMDYESASNLKNFLLTEGSTLFNSAQGVQNNLGLNDLIMAMGG